MGPSSPQLLLVDDTPTNIRVLRHALDGQGYDLLVALNGPEALNIARMTKPALVLLDVMMPEMDGFEVCRQLKNNPHTKDCAVIFLSAVGEVNNKIKGFQLGAVDYITKPFQMDEVIARVNTHITIRQLQMQVQAANQKMKRDLESARHVQQTLLPLDWANVPGYRFCWKYQPCEELAGDSLNIFHIDDDHIGFYVLDVTGHGVKAALLSVAVTYAMVPRNGDQSANDQHSFRSFLNPENVVNRMNESFTFNEETGQFFTLFYGVLNRLTGELRYTNAAHPNPMWFRKQGGVELLDTPGLPIGIDTDGDYAEGSLTMNPGDRIYLYSDGLAEELNPEGKMFGFRRIQQSLADHQSLPLDETLDQLVTGALQWSNAGSFRDDLSLLAIERL